MLCEAMRGWLLENTAAPLEPKVFVGIDEDLVAAIVREIAFFAQIEQAI
jgi:hypothetical protein